MKYVVITSKHHDGFAIFDSAVHRLRHHGTPSTAGTSWGRSRPR
ncbi:MAG: alpha-L-fucosidase [Ignavibacteriales bacterium]|nr:alpha-L-fucosidase [Ignavibacteriales bacterium]